MKFRNAKIVIILIAALSAFAFGQAVKENPEDLRMIDVDEKLGDTIPLDLAFIDDKGDNVKLSQYFGHGKPVIIILGYYSCPMLCNLVMNGVTDAIRGLNWVPGDKYDIVSVSIDPTETDVLAKAKKANYLKDLGLPGAESGWAFLTDPDDNTRKLADAVGFKYFYVEERQEYAHPAVLVVLTPDGKISRYLYGIEFKQFDLKLALLEASEGRVGSTVDKFILYCYHYDPNSGSYTVFAGNLMRLGGGLTLVLVAVLLGFYWLKERRRKTLGVV